MSAVPAAVSGIFDAVDSNVSVAYAPSSINLLGGSCASSDGTLLTIAIPAYAMIGIEKIDEQQLVIVYKRKTTKMDFPDSIPVALSQMSTAVAAAIAALQHSLHLVSRNNSGLEVIIVSTITPGRGFGEIPAIQYALAPALDACSGDRDDAPTCTRIATAPHETMVQIKGQSQPLYPYTTALCSRPNSLLCINHSGEAVTQTVLPQLLALTVAYSSDVTGGPPDKGRYEFFQQAYVTSGVPTPTSLPDPQEQVADRARARHEVHPDNEDIPTTGRAIQWLDGADVSSDRAHIVVGHIRHSDIQTAVTGVLYDASERGFAPLASSVLGQIAGLTSIVDCEKIARCVPCPGASLVMWPHIDDADRIASALNDGGSETIRVENTLADVVAE